MLGHVDRSVTGIYDRFEYLNEKRIALDTWDRQLDCLRRELARPSPNPSEFGDLRIQERRALPIDPRRRIEDTRRRAQASVCLASAVSSLARYPRALTRDELTLR